MKQATDLERLYALRTALAGHVIRNPALSPILDRLEQEIAIGESFENALSTGDLLAQARAVAASYRMAA